MFYKVKIWWNGTQVLDARATLVMAYDIARAQADNFAGKSQKEALDAMPQSIEDVKIVAAEKSFWRYFDDTGDLQVWIGD